MPLNCIPATSTPPRSRPSARRRAAASPSTSASGAAWCRATPRRCRRCSRPACSASRRSSATPGVAEFPAVGEPRRGGARRARAGSAGVPLLVHAELPAPSTRRATGRRRRAPPLRDAGSPSRPAALRATAIELLAALAAARTGGAVHVVHRQLRRARWRWSPRRAGAAAAAHRRDLPALPRARRRGDRRRRDASSSARRRSASAPTARRCGGRSPTACSTSSPPITRRARRPLKRLEPRRLRRRVGRHRLAAARRCRWCGPAARERGFGARALPRWMAAAPARLAGLAGARGDRARARRRPRRLGSRDPASRSSAAKLYHRHSRRRGRAATSSAPSARTYLRGRLVWDGERVGGATGESCCRHDRGERRAQREPGVGGGRGGRRRGRRAVPRPARPRSASASAAPRCAANDEFFAPKENLVRAGRAALWTRTRTPSAASGWTAGRRGAGASRGTTGASVRLGAARASSAALVVDTQHFRGNHPRSLRRRRRGAARARRRRQSSSPPACDLATAGAAQRRSAATARNLLRGRRAASALTHVRLHDLPRRRGGAAARPRRAGARLGGARVAGGEIDLAAARARRPRGRRAATCSSARRHNLILPGPPRDMGDGWETRRRRGPGHDWTVVALGRAGRLRRVAIDTTYFKGNAPGRGGARRLRARRPGAATATDWQPLLPRTPLRRRHAPRVRGRAGRRRRAGHARAPEHLPRRRHRAPAPLRRAGARRRDGRDRGRGARSRCRPREARGGAARLLRLAALGGGDGGAAAVRPTSTALPGRRGDLVGAGARRTGSRPSPPTRASARRAARGAPRATAPPRLVGGRAGRRRGRRGADAARRSPTATAPTRSASATSSSICATRQERRGDARARSSGAWATTRATELRIAAAEQAAITRLRLARLVAEDGGHAS